MAASKSYFPRSNHRFLPSCDQAALIANENSIVFELDESDVWYSPPPAQSTESREPAAASMPVNVPDWSKILRHEYKENRRVRSGDDYDMDGGGYERLPPHEYLARSRIASLSVHEGLGRTLKGRDLSRVRNAIWQKTGFQD